MARIPRTWLLSLTLAAACSGQIGQPDGPNASGPGREAARGAPNAPGAPGAPAAAGGVTGLTSSGRTGPRRLTNLEYDNTVRDLLGTERRLAASFVAEEGAGFDNVASALGMTPSQYESYFNAAETLAAEFFASKAQRDANVGCTASGSDGGPCLSSFLKGLGARVYRRPLRAEEQQALKQAYARARALGESEQLSLEHVLTAMLASAPFLYRTELVDSSAPATFARPLDGFELAARLSYFLWSTLPDAELFRLAADGSLLEDKTLGEQLARMLDDARAETLVDNFAAQWLGLRELAQHKVLSERYPEFDDTLRASMIEEARAYFAEFLFQDRPLSDFLQAPLHFVDTRLAAHYGLGAVTAKGLTRIEQPVGQRRGFLGLASFLTVSSFAHRTSPTLRAKWVLEELLCSSVPPPPANVVGELEGADMANAAAAIENVRARLELHRSEPKCAGCHRMMDPIGLGLESFDGIGRSRTRYDNGDLVDTHGEFPDGTTFDGPVELSAILAKDPRFMRCATQKVLTYALGRAAEDEPELVDATLASFRARGTLRALIESVVLSEAFRRQLNAGGEP